MKPYGISRKKMAEYPDILDIQNLGLKSSVGRIKPKNGKDYKSYTRNTEKRNKTRLIYKKNERTLAKKMINSFKETEF